MRSIIVASTRPYSGKTGICLALIRELEERGLAVGYFKPYGTMPIEADGLVTDRDAYYLNRSLAEPGPLEAVCPVVRSRAFVEDLLAGRPVPGASEVKAAFARASAGRDVMVIEGPSDMEEGVAAGLSHLRDGRHARRARADRPRQSTGFVCPTPSCTRGSAWASGSAASCSTACASRTGPRCSTTPCPFLEGRGVRTFGTIAHDPMLSSVTVREIVEVLDGAVLCAEEHLDDPVESFMVGAMGQEKALRFFRRKSHKAVITGGDRADVQLAALETSTSALILTGNLPPSPIVLARADELGIPMLLVDTDTLTAVERMETLMGHVRLHGSGKVDRIRAMFAEGVALDDLLAAFVL